MNPVVINIENVKYTLERNDKDISYKKSTNYVNEYFISQVK